MPRRDDGRLRPSLNAGLPSAVRSDATRPASSHTRPSGRQQRDLKAGQLAVGPRQVVQLVEAGDRGLVAEGAVWAAMVVGPEPAVKGCGAFGVGAIDRAVGPAAEEGADKALCLAVGARPVGPGAQVPEAHRAAGERVDG